MFRPRWVPSLDAPVGESGKSQPANGLAWFERTVFYAARVLNASSVGSQIISRLYAIYGGSRVWMQDEVFIARSLQYSCER